MSGSIGITALNDTNKDLAVNGEMMINEFSGMISIKNSNGDVVSFSQSGRVSKVIEFLEKIYQNQLMNNFRIYQCPINSCLITGNIIEAIDLNTITQSGDVTNIAIFFDVISQDSDGNYILPIDMNQTVTINFPGSGGTNIPVTTPVNNFSSIDITKWIPTTTDSTRKINSINLWSSNTPKSVLIGIYIVALPKSANGIYANYEVLVS